MARAVAERMQGLADAAQQDADAAGRVYLAAAHGDGTTISSMPAVFGAGNDLLAGLGGVARVAQIAGDADELLEDRRAARRRRRPRHRSAPTPRGPPSTSSPSRTSKTRSPNAEAALADAKQELADLQADATTRSRLASSSVSLIATLPTDAGQLSDQGWALPVAGRITDGFGPRPVKPLAGVNEFHRGTDLAAACQSPVFAATSGVVVERRAEREPRQLDPRSITARASRRATAHLVAGGIFVAPGETVTAGQLIGAVGSTGASTGCHLHFEVHLDGVAIDAVPFMAARGILLG